MKPSAELAEGAAGAEGCHHVAEDSGLPGTSAIPPSLTHGTGPMFEMVSCIDNQFTPCYISHSVKGCHMQTGYKPQVVKHVFDRDGFVILRGFLDEQEVGEVRENVERYIEEVIPAMPSEQVYYEVPERKETLKQLQKMHTHDPFFEELFVRRLSPLAEVLLDGDVIPTNMQYFNKPPGIGKPTPVHQDGFYFKIKPKEALTMWLALDQVDDENGCIRYVRGAHKQGLREHARTQTLGFSQGLVTFTDEDRRAETTIQAEPGDLSAHHCLMVHRADGNSSGRQRRALGFIYYSARVEEDTAEMEVYQTSLIADLKRQGKL